MSNTHYAGTPIHFAIEIEGLELLSDALLNAPESVTRTAEDAGLDALGVLGPAIDRATPVQTGFLRSNNELSLETAFTVVYANFTPYAIFVEADQHYVERGVESVQPEIEAIYERAMDDLAATFGRGI